MKKIMFLCLAIIVGLFFYVSNYYFEPSKGQVEVTKWNSHKITEYFPKPKEENIVEQTYAIDLKVVFDMNWSKEEALDYIELCRNSGFVSHVGEMIQDGVTTWMAKTSDKSLDITITYDDENNGTLTLWKIK